MKCYYLYFGDFDSAQGSNEYCGVFHMQTRARLPFFFFLFFFFFICFCMQTKIISVENSRRIICTNGTRDWHICLSEFLLFSCQILSPHFLSVSHFTFLFHLRFVYISVLRLTVQQNWHHSCVLQQFNPWNGWANACAMLSFCNKTMFHPINFIWIIWIVLNANKHRFHLFFLVQLWPAIALWSFRWAGSFFIVLNGVQFDDDFDGRCIFAKAKFLPRKQQ